MNIRKKLLGLAALASTLALAIPAIASATVTIGATSPADGSELTTVSWSGISSVTKYDEIGAYNSSSALIGWFYTGSCNQTLPSAGAASGSCGYTFSSPGTFSFEVWHGSTGSNCTSGPPGDCTLKATSSTITVPSPSVALALDTPTPGEVDANFFHITNPTVDDEIKFYNAADDSLVATIYDSSCGSSPGGTAYATDSCTYEFTTTGSYYAKVYSGATLEATSSDLSVPAVATLLQLGGSNTNTYELGGWILANPTNVDEFLVYNSSNVLVDWMYDNSCTQIAGYWATQNPICYYSFSTSDTYHIKVQADASEDIQATSSALAVSSPPTISTTQPSGSSTSVTVSYGGVASASTTDKLEVFNAGGTEIGWVYDNSCTQTAGGSASTSGSCSYTLPGGGGTYKLKLYADSEVEATTAAAGDAVVSPASLSVALHDANKSATSVDVSYSNALDPSAGDIIKVYTSSTAADSSSVDWFYANSCTQTEGGSASSSGSCTYTPYAPETGGPVGAGYFEFRLFQVNADSSSVSVATSNAMLNILPKFAEETGDDSDPVDLVTYDGFEFLEPNNASNLDKWPGHCGSSSFCGIPWTGEGAPRIDCYFGDISSPNSNDCLLAEVSGSETANYGVYSDVSNGNTNYIEPYDFPEKVQLPTGDLFFAHYDEDGNVDGYIHVPADSGTPGVDNAPTTGYYNTVNDGFTQCDAGSNLWCGFAQLPVLPLPYLGEDLGCACAPATNTDVTSTTGCASDDSCPTPVQLNDSGDIYVYNSVEHAYDQVPVYGNNNDTGSGTEYGFNQDPDSPLLTLCPLTYNPWLDSDGDWCGITHLDSLGAPIKTGEQEELESFECFVDSPGLDLEGDELSGNGDISCLGGEEPYKAEGVQICLQAQSSVTKKWSNVGSCVTYNFPVAKFNEGLYGGNLTIESLYTCLGTTQTVWRMVVIGKVLDSQEDPQTQTIFYPGTNARKISCSTG